jgi:hypothetical protein
MPLNPSPLTITPTLNTKKIQEIKTHQALLKTHSFTLKLDQNPKSNKMNTETSCNSNKNATIIHLKHREPQMSVTKKRQAKATKTDRIVKKANNRERN